MSLFLGNAPILYAELHQLLPEISTFMHDFCYIPLASFICLCTRSTSALPIAQARPWFAEELFIQELARFYRNAGQRGPDPMKLGYRTASSQQLVSLGRKLPGGVITLLSTSILEYSNLQDYGALIESFRMATVESSTDV